MAISFVVLVILLSFRNEPNKMQEMARYDSYVRWTAAPSSIAWGRRHRSLPPSSALSAPSASCNVGQSRPPLRLLLFPPLPWLLLSSLSSLLLLRMLFPFEAEASTAVVIPSATPAYPAPPNQNGGRRWLLAHASMVLVHIFVVTLTPPPSLSSLPSFSSSSSFLQSLSPPPPVTVAAVDVHVDLHNHPPQQPLARDCRFHRPFPRV